MDETYGRDVTSTEGIETRGTVYLVLSLAKRGVVCPERAQMVINAIVNSGWYWVLDTYAKIV